MPAPRAFVGRTMRQVELRSRHGVTLIAVRRRVPGSDTETVKVVPGPDDRIEEGDILVLLGSNERLAELDALLKA